MPRDPLQILHAVRRRGVDAAATVIAARVATESAAQRRLLAIDAARQRERDSAAKQPDSYQFQDMAALRLRKLQADHAAAQTDLDAAESQTRTAREHLLEQRTAEKSVATLVEQREATALANALRREQHTLDDIARQRTAQRSRPANTHQSENTILDH
jgi:flagellar export protein FliJ